MTNRRPQGDPTERRDWYIRFDVKAWLTDGSLRRCHPATRGVWIDLICLAAESSRYGFLTDPEGTPLTIGDIVAQTGIERRLLIKAVAELESRGVFSRAENGAIYSRRMVRDAEERARSRSFGKQGGNPWILGSEASDEQIGSKSATNSQQDGTGSAADLSQIGKPLFSVISDMAANRVNPLPKPLESESESEDKEKSPSDSVASASRNVVLFPENSSPLLPAATPARGKRAHGAGDPAQIGMENAALDAWNRLAAVSHVASGTMTVERRRKLRLRLAEIGGLSGWQKAIAAVERSPLWQGKVGRGWKPCFDDMLSPTKLTKLLEGAYDGQMPNPAPPRQSARWANLQTTLDGARPTAPTIDHVDDAVPTLEAKGMWG